jgi:hypothetical protein
MEDFLAEGEAMESVIEQTGLAVRAEAESEYGESAIECRRIAVGVLAVCVGYVSEMTGDSELVPDTAYFQTCLASFIQGSKVTERMISEGQYVKAAAMLKQDYELLVRIHEARAGWAVEGKQPNVRNGPSGSQRYYGELNKIAHPCNLDLLIALLSSQSGHLSIPPVFVKDTAKGLYRLHIWLHCEMVRLSLDFLAAIEQPSELEVCITAYENLVKMANLFVSEHTGQ